MAMEMGKDEKRPRINEYRIAMLERPHSIK